MSKGPPLPRVKTDNVLVPINSCGDEANHEPATIDAHCKSKPLPRPSTLALMHFSDFAIDATPEGEAGNRLRIQSATLRLSSRPRIPTCLRTAPALLQAHMPGEASQRRMLARVSPQSWCCVSYGQPESLSPTSTLPQHTNGRRENRIARSPVNMHAA